MKSGIRVRVVDNDFVKQNGVSVGVLTKSLWFINHTPHLYGGIAKIFVYEVYFVDIDLYVIFTPESIEEIKE